MTSGATFIDALRALTVQFAAFEALLLMVSAGHKTVRWSYSRGVVLEFAKVPAALAAPALAGVALVESAAAAMLLLPAYRAIGGLLAASVWTVYLALIVRAIIQGRRDADCGCSFGPTRRPLGWFQVSRSALLLGVAAMVTGVSAAGGSVAVESFQVLAACALLALYGALDQVMALRPLRSGEVL
jgi:hypothetical protein